MRKVWWKNLVLSGEKITSLLSPFFESKIKCELDAQMWTCISGLKLKQAKDLCIDASFYQK